MQRATHLLWDEPPKLLEDTLALRLCGLENEAALQTTNDAAMAQAAQRFGLDFAQRLVRLGRSPVVLRSRYVEDELDQAIKRGVSQYVIFGAGLDSFAYRKRHLVDVLHVFEVDQPCHPGLEAGASFPSISLMRLSSGQWRLSGVIRTDDDTPTCS